MIADGKRMFDPNAHVHQLAEEDNGDLYFIIPGHEEPLNLTFLANR